MGDEQRFRVMRNEHGWFAVPPGSIDLEATPIGHGDSPEAAIRSLLSEPRFAALAKLHGWHYVGRSDFTVDPGDDAGLAERARMKQHTSGGQ
jgi:hypothetical protein